MNLHWSVCTYTHAHTEKIERRREKHKHIHSTHTHAQCTLYMLRFITILMKSLLCHFKWTQRNKLKRIFVIPVSCPQTQKSTISGDHLLQLPYYYTGWSLEMDFKRNSSSRSSIAIVNQLELEQRVPCRMRAKSQALRRYKIATTYTCRQQKMYVCLPWKWKSWGENHMAISKLYFQRHIFAF